MPDLIIRLQSINISKHSNIKHWLETVSLKCTCYNNCTVARLHAIVSAQYDYMQFVDMRTMPTLNLIHSVNLCSQPFIYFEFKLIICSMALSSICKCYHNERSAQEHRTSYFLCNCINE